jgi:hypothetical protein
MSPLFKGIGVDALEKILKSKKTEKKRGIHVFDGTIMLYLQIFF